MTDSQDPGPNPAGPGSPPIIVSSQYKDLLDHYSKHEETPGRYSAVEIWLEEQAKRFNGPEITSHKEVAGWRSLHNFCTVFEQPEEAIPDGWSEKPFNKVMKENLSKVSSFTSRSISGNVRLNLFAVETCSSVRRRIFVREAGVLQTLIVEGRKAGYYEDHQGYQNHVVDDMLVKVVGLSTNTSPAKIDDDLRGIFFLIRNSMIKISYIGDKTMVDLGDWILSMADSMCRLKQFSAF